MQKGFLCHLNLCYKKEVCNVIFPVVTINGDGKSQDMMVGRYGTKNLNTACLMWICDCTTFNANNHIPTRNY